MANFIQKFLEFFGLEDESDEQFVQNPYLSIGLDSAFHPYTALGIASAYGLCSEILSSAHINDSGIKAENNTIGSDDEMNVETE
ncbi:unnamed protein product [Brachionus calyciflorus]|uniref:Uncharacterized protein n=1 Tax=Brachionus calyciflorus TaxID=104777 RepID=A0A813XKZ6_9BILA|nr:unnamed protein product [Brachionus calyciflorus]